MPLIRLINPNTSAATTRMMVKIARAALPAHFELEGVTATDGVPMIVNAAQLIASEQGVIKMATADAGQVAGVIISAFGDPAIDTVSRLIPVPVVGICEASMLEAAMGQRRFGIATVTPDLVESFGAKAKVLGLSHLFTGTRLTSGDPQALTADRDRLERALAAAAAQCFEDDGAEAVIIGGGPLGQAALALRERFSAPVIAPIPAAVARLVQRLAAAKTATSA